MSNFESNKYLSCSLLFSVSPVRNFSLNLANLRLCETFFRNRFSRKGAKAQRLFRTELTEKRSEQLKYLLLSKLLIACCLLSIAPLISQQHNLLLSQRHTIYRNRLQ